jgi:hypothetical protein
LASATLCSWAFFLPLRPLSFFLLLPFKYSASLSQCVPFPGHLIQPQGSVAIRVGNISVHMSHLNLFCGFSTKLPQCPTQYSGVSQSHNQFNMPPNNSNPPELPNALPPNTLSKPENWLLLWALSLGLMNNSLQRTVHLASKHVLLVSSSLLLLF